MLLTSIFIRGPYLYCANVTPLLCKVRSVHLWFDKKYSVRCHTRELRKTKKKVVKNNTKWITKNLQIKKRKGRAREWNMNRYFHRSLSTVTKLHLKLWPSLYNGQRSEVNRTHYQKNALTLKNATALILGEWLWGYQEWEDMLDSHYLGSLWCKHS